MENNEKEIKTITFKPEYSGFKGQLMSSIFLILYQQLSIIQD